MFERAPLRVRPANGEPPGWLLHRLAHRNGFENAAEFARNFRTSADDIRRGSADARLAELSGIPESMLAEWSPRESGTSVVLRGQTLRSPYDWASGIPGTPLRACPECLRSDLAGREGPKASRPHMRAWWCLRDVHHCHLHGCLLVERPARSPRPFAGPGSRRGGARPFWVDFVEVRPERIDADACKADLYVLGRMGLVPAKPHAVLDALALGEASAILSWLGELAVTGTEAMDVRTRPFAEAMRIRSQGLELAEDWPSRILVRLTEVLHERLIRRDGSGGYYGRFYRRLYDDRMMRFKHEGRDVLRKLLERHALENVPFQHGETMFKQSVDRSRRVHLKHAARIAGVSTSEFEGIAKALDVLEPGRMASDPWGVTRHAAERVRLACEGAIRAPSTRRDDRIDHGGNRRAASPGVHIPGMGSADAEPVLADVSGRRRRNPAG